MCDLNGWNTCVPTNVASCGIQMCQWGPLGQGSSPVEPLSGPVPMWGPCTNPWAPPVVDAGAGEAGADAGD